LSPHDGRLRPNAWSLDIPGNLRYVPAGRFGGSMKTIGLKARLLCRTALLVSSSVSCATAFAAEPRLPPPAGAIRTQAEVAVSVEQAQGAALAALVQARKHPDAGARYRMVVPFGAPLFPRDADLQAFELKSLVGANGQALRDWLALPAAARRYDLWIVPDVDYYWMSDYVVGNEPADFSAEFLVHFASTATGATRISVIQLKPRLRLGRKFALLGRTGPGFYWDIRSVAASPQATADLLAWLTGANKAGEQ
jgi:hypothetical protein